MNATSVNLHEYYSNHVSLHNFAWSNMGKFCAHFLKCGTFSIIQALMQVLWHIMIRKNTLIYLRNHKTLLTIFLQKKKERKRKRKRGEGWRSEKSHNSILHYIGFDTCFDSLIQYAKLFAWAILHVHRHGNSVTYNFAKHAFHVTDLSMWMEDISPHLITLVQASQSFLLKILTFIKKEREREREREREGFTP